MTATGVPLALAALVLAGALLGGGCTSTQEKSAELERQGGQAFQEEGLEVVRQSRDVRVESRTVLSDRNGAAVVAVIRNRTERPLARVPVAIDVADARGRSVFRNDDPGIEPSLAGISLLRPRQKMAWVHDQVLSTGPVRRASVVAGSDRGGAVPAELPEIDVGPAKLVTDATSGIAAEGEVVNRSDVLQRELVIYGVAWRGGRVVAAGRSQVERLRPGRDATYQIFFIGNPRGARIELAAPPTRLE